jgi:hypothetical protein
MAAVILVERIRVPRTYNDRDERIWVRATENVAAPRRRD